MKLIYHNDFNFGDALNPLLFQKLLPDFFDDDDSEVFLGIGTILEWYKPLPHTKKHYVFSSGSGYGDMHELDNTWEVLCVRGPLTAEKLHLDPKLGIADAGILADRLIEGSTEKSYACSYIPHHYSEEKYTSWRGVCEKAGLHFISPTLDRLNTVEHVLREIAASELIVCEAMHGAILADALRVPWIPVKAYKHINDFKWRDYGSAMEFAVRLHEVPSIFSDAFLRSKFAAKLPVSLPGPLFNLLCMAGGAAINHTEEQVVRALEKVRSATPILISDQVLNNRREQLMQILRKFESQKRSA